MGAWETDDEYLSGPAATSLPTPQDTPYRTPSSTTRKSRRSVTPPGKSGKSISPARQKGSRRSSQDLATDETISILDPRRFTPTLHANLVSEILALRRDQEEKIKIIETLESSFHTTREERDTLQQNLANTGKESRSLKRQLSLLEGGTSSALGELARERDEAVESVAETKKRLEAAQKKIRTQEEDSERVHRLLAEEKEAWEEEKRKYERKIHITESRLKVVLDEVAAYQAAQAQHAEGHGLDSEAEESGRENDCASIRTMSMTNSIRFSVMSGSGFMKPNGKSLADELNFDDDEQSDLDGRESALSNYHHIHSRNFSRDSVMSRIHRRNQSLESLKRSGSVARSRLFMNQSVLEALEGEDEEAETPAPKPSYVDSGIQFSPPPSPKMTPSKPSTPEPVLSRSKSPEVEYSPRAEGEIEANQSRKRVHAARPLSIETVTVRKVMVSTSSQTMEDPPLTPPKTPKSPSRPPPPPPPPVEIKKPEMVTSCTQTDVPEPLTRAFEFPPMPPSPPPAIPSISVHPPTSRPTTPREPRLPQHFKDFGCQVSILAPAATSEAGVQTEGIQIDKRLARLPTHLQPSSITSRPSSPNPPLIVDPPKTFTPVPGNTPGSVPPRNPRRLTKRETPDLPPSPIFIADCEATRDAYPGNNDDGPLSSQKAPMRRPHRFSSLFAGFDGGSSDEVDEFGDFDMSDSEYRTALSAPRPKSITAQKSKRSSTGTVTTNGTIPGSPEQVVIKQVPRGSVKPFANDMMSYFSENKDKDMPVRMSSVKSGRIFEKSPAAMSSNRASVMRKAAMIQSGIASHQGRARSPSLTESNNPPFPIPTRASSRKLPGSSSVPSDGQRSPTRGEMLTRRGTGRSHYRAGSIRKVRSATALPRNQRYRRQGSRSPPPLSPSTEAPESPGLPPLPRNDITTPRSRSRQYRHQHELSVTTDNTMSSDPPLANGDGSINESTQSNTVVDAIAQTMVGEWMFKYVRRRKSFGVPEANMRDENSNDRHKRWVWLAPYERSILWSSKQPSSGSALMGKTGRKLVIQSVLDVKDDNPTPRGSPSVFNRSILILTPQRALKFTATSAERHYVWLTALSFLAHSSQAVPENITHPQIDRPAPLPEFEMPKTKLKRGGIRDSIRLAKGRGHAPKAPVPSVPSIPSAPSSQMGDVLSFSMVDSVGVISSNHSRDGSADAAEPPFIPRFHERNNPPPPGASHVRKRSNTGGHVPPPLSFRGFSGPAGGVHHAATNSTAGASINTAGSSDIYQSQASSTGTWGMSQTASQRTSEASSRPSNFFDAIGTVRMEAFISPLAFSQFNDYPDEQDEFRQEVRRRSKEHRRRQSRSRHQDSYSSRGTRGTGDYYGSKTAGEEDFFRDDPFKGF